MRAIYSIFTILIICQISTANTKQVKFTCQGNPSTLVDVKIEITSHINQPTSQLSKSWTGVANIYYSGSSNPSQPIPRLDYVNIPFTGHYTSDQRSTQYYANDIAISPRSPLRLTLSINRNNLGQSEDYLFVGSTKNIVPIICTEISN